MAEKKTGAKVETAAGAAALGTGVGIRPAAFGAYRAKQNKLAGRRAAAQDYLSQGGKPKRDPSKVNLNTAKKKEALRTVNETSHALKRLKPPTKVNRSGVWVPLTVGGAAASWHGGRKLVEKADKGFKRRDFDAVAGGAAVGAATHQAVGLGGTLKRMKVMDRHTGSEKATVRAYNKKAIPKGGMQTGDPKWKGYWRNYPKNVSGGKLARTLSHTHSGKTGMAVLGATTAAGAGASYAGNKKVRKSMSESAFGVDHGEFSKGVIDTAAVGSLGGMMGGQKAKKKHRGKAQAVTGASTAAGYNLGGTAGALAGYGATRSLGGAYAGSVAGSVGGTVGGYKAGRKISQKRGWERPQKKKS